jgi:hypothetical protein
MTSLNDQVPMCSISLRRREEEQTVTTPSSTKVFPLYHCLYLCRCITFCISFRVAHHLQLVYAAPAPSGIRPIRHQLLDPAIGICALGNTPDPAIGLSQRQLRTRLGLEKPG